jgi:membrane protein insertase Oxa1/YidC/SpoIIIJ
MILTWWHDLLYQPVLNALFVLYGSVAMENIGLAVIILTVVMRVLLLPLSVIAERNRGKIEALSERIADLGKHFKNDPVKLREETRKMLRANHLNPWAKAAVLGVQALLFLLLYQVFIRGLNAAQLGDLYAFVVRPEAVNTMFLGFDVAMKSNGWAIAVGVLLFVQIVIAQIPRKHALERKDVWFRFGFPISVALILAQLPMVKSLFVLTSMGFSAFLFSIRKGVTPS